MEEDDQQITGWSDRQFKILAQNKHSPNEVNCNKKLKPSQTLPFIKNKFNFDKPIPSTIFKKQLKYFEKPPSIQGTSQVQFSKKSFDVIPQKELNRRKLTLKQQSDDQQLKNNCLLSVYKRLRKAKKISSIKKDQKMSNFQLLKVQVSEYLTPKTRLKTEQEKFELLKQISKKPIENLQNLQKFSKKNNLMIKKQQLSSEVLSDNISKVTISYRQSSNDQNITEMKRNEARQPIQKYKKISRNSIHIKCEYHKSDLQTEDLPLQNLTLTNPSCRIQINQPICTSYLMIQQMKKGKFSPQINKKTKPIKTQNRIFKQSNNQDKTITKIKFSQQHKLSLIIKPSPLIFFDTKLNKSNKNLPISLANKLLNTFKDDDDLSFTKKTFFNKFNFFKSKKLLSKEQTLNEQFNDEFMFLGQQSRKN